MARQPVLLLLFFISTISYVRSAKITPIPMVSAVDHPLILLCPDCACLPGDKDLDRSWSYDEDGFDHQRIIENGPKTCSPFSFNATQYYRPNMDLEPITYTLSTSSANLRDSGYYTCECWSKDKRKTVKTYYRVEIVEVWFLYVGASVGVVVLIIVVFLTIYCCRKHDGITKIKGKLCSQDSENGQNLQNMDSSAPKGNINNSYMP